MDWTSDFKIEQQFPSQTSWNIASRLSPPLQTTRFRAPSEIPSRFIERNVSLRGRVRSITDRGVEVEHVPVYLPVLSPLLSKFKGINGFLLQTQKQASSSDVLLCCYDFNWLLHQQLHREAVGEAAFTNMTFDTLDLQTSLKSFDLTEVIPLRCGHILNAGAPCRRGGDPRRQSVAPGEPGSCSDRLAPAHQPGGRRAALPGASEQGEAASDWDTATDVSTISFKFRPLPSLVSPAGVSLESLCKWRAPLAWLGPHRARRRGPARLSHLLASPQTAAQGRGQSWAEGAWPVAAGQHVGKDLQRF